MPAPSKASNRRGVTGVEYALRPLGQGSGMSPEDLAVSRYLAPLATTWLSRHGCCLGLAALA
jgi:hypothetical protein